MSERIKEIFHQFDRNNNNTIDKKELYSLSLALNSELSPAELSDLFTSIDSDNSNTITWEEFIKYLSKE